MRRAIGSLPKRSLLGTRRTTRGPPSETRDRVPKLPSRAPHGATHIGSVCPNPFQTQPERRPARVGQTPSAVLRDLGRRSQILPYLKPRPQIGQDYPLNLSILISGGKETNRDSPSSGERSGNSSSFKSGVHRAFRIVAFRAPVAGSIVRVRSPLERGVLEGENPMTDSSVGSTASGVRRVG